MPRTLAPPSPDGSEIAGSIRAKAERASRTGERLPNTILGHLPMAVAVVDHRARLIYWNTQASVLWNLPSFLNSERPPLAQAVARLTMLSASQQDHIVDFCKQQIDQGDHVEPETWLRISPKRDWRLSIQVRGMGRKAWLILLHDSRTDDMLARAAAEKQTADGAYDVLTMVRSQWHFEQMLTKLPAEGNHAVLLIDVDALESINDARGREVGDSLLCLIARRLPRAMRDDDVLARWVDDAFAVLIPNNDGAFPLARRLLNTLSQPFLINGQPLTASFSIGIAYWHGSPELLMDHATVALRAAKQAGQNQCASYDGQPATITAQPD